MILPQSVAGTIFSRDRKQILLIQRRDVPVWVLPGGGVEAQETPEEAISREVLEETGFHVKVERLVGIYTPMNRLAKLTHLYDCKILKGEAQISDETRSVKFFPLEKLPKLIPPPYPEWIFDAKNKGSLIQKKLRSVNYKTLFINLIFHPILVLRFLLARLGLSINSK